MTVDEIKMIRELNLSDNEKLENTRNLFMFLCFSSLRISDLKNMKPENIDLNNNLISLYAIKTDKKTLIPITAPLEPYVKKFLQGEFRFISDQKLNSYIKELCQLAGIDTPVQQVKFSGKKRTEAAVPKHRLVSSKTGRKTFVTLSHKLGLNLKEIMNITGHSKAETLQSYLGINSKESSEAVKKAWKDFNTQ